MRGRLLVGLSLAAALGASVARSAEVRRGRYEINFTRRSPLSSVKILKQRLGRSVWEEKLGQSPSTVDFGLLVPSDYDPAAPHGLLVLEGGLMAESWDRVFADRKLVCVGVPVAYSGFMLDAVHNVKELCNIDDDRVYAFGSGKACALGIAFPDVFGGTVCLGVLYFRYVSDNPELSHLPGFFPRPSDDLLSLAKKRCRFAFISHGSTDPDAHDRKIEETVNGGLRKDGFEHVGFVTMPGKTGRFSKEWLGECLDFLDVPLKGKAKSAYEQAVEFERKGAHGAALEAHLKSLQRDPSGEWADDAKARVASLRMRAERETAEAKRALAEGRYFDAISTLRRVLKRFGEKGAPEAAGLLARIEADPEHPRRLKAAAEKKARDRHEKAARQSLEIARKIFERDKMRGYDALRNVAKQHAATAAGREAAAELQRIMADPELRRAIEGAKDAGAADRLLRQARNYAANGMNSQARAKLKEIVTKFPDTRAAEQAKKMLRDLGGG